MRDVQEHLHPGALAGGEVLLVAVKGRTAPANEAGRIFCSASLRPGVLRDRQLVRYNSLIGRRSAKACSVLPGGGGYAGVDSLDDQLALILGGADPAMGRRISTNDPLSRQENQPVSRLEAPCFTAVPENDGVSTTCLTWDYLN